MHPNISLYDVSKRSLDSLPWSQMRESLVSPAKQPFMIIRNAVPIDRVERLLDRAQRFLDSTPAAPRRAYRGMPDTNRVEDSAKDPTIFRKKHMRLAHFFEWNPTYAELMKELDVTFHVRNLLSGLTPERLAHFYTPVQFLHYPTGGGWLEKHQDSYEKSDKLTSQEALDYNVIVLSLTRKGVNFKTGGLYGEINGAHIDLEEHIERGDLVVFNQTVLHGVDPVDPEGSGPTNLREGKCTILVTPFPNSRLKEPT